MCRCAHGYRWAHVFLGCQSMSYFYDFISMILRRALRISGIRVFDKKNHQTTTGYVIVYYHVHAASQSAQSNRNLNSQNPEPKLRKSGLQNMNHVLTISSGFLFFKNEIISFHTKPIESSWLCQIVGNNLL